MRSNRIVSVAGDVAVVDVSTPKYPGVVTLIDEADLHIVTESPRRWCVWRNNRGVLYVVRILGTGKNQRTEFLHRAILGLTDTNIKGDHRGHDTLDNTRAKLRRATNTQNCQNSRSAKGSASRFLGVSRSPRNDKWRARIRYGGVSRHIGTFATEVDAARAYDTIAAREFGEFANLNFPEAVAA